MHWQFEQASLQGYQIDELQQIDSAVVVSPVQDYRAQLFDEERQELVAMAEKRQLGFASGRYCAQSAQRLLRLEPAPVLRQDRVPVWPSTSVGSITHCDKIAAAAASTGVRSIGIDIETCGRVDQKLYEILFTETERARLKSLPGDAATLIFSAKEAGYKAIYPHGRKFIGFQEVEIEVDAESHTFGISYVGSYEPNRIAHEGIGYWKFYDDHVFTVFVIE
jgi:4'-phosphopantetheinyl transferase EntD